MGRVCINKALKRFFIFALVILMGFSFQLNAFSKVGSYKNVLCDSSNLENFIILTKKDFIDALKPIEEFFPQYNYFYIPVESIGLQDPMSVRKYIFEHFNSGYLLIALNEHVLEQGTLTIDQSGSFSPKTVKSDMFYGLEDIDFDNDGNYGEFYDDILKSGLKFRFIVARLPFDSIKDFQKYFESLKAFRDKLPLVLLAASFIAFPNETYDGGKILTGDGARLTELLKERFFNDAITLYEKGGDFPSIYDCTMPLNRENFISASKNATLILWDAHGSQTGAYSETWTDKNGNGIPENGEFTFMPFISSSDTFSTNAIVFSGSCLNLQGYNNLGNAFLKNGSVAFVGSREVSYAPSYFHEPSDGGSSSIMYYFAENLYKGKTIGKALYDSFKYFYDNLLYSDLEDPVESGLLNIYDFNIYGLPSITLNYVKSERKSIGGLNQKDLSFEFNYDDNKKEFIIKVLSDTPYFVILPKGLFVKRVYYENSKNAPIFDWYFNIVRANFHSPLVIIGVVRGEVQGNVIVKGDDFENHYPVSFSGFDIKDFNFDFIVDETDFEMLKQSFGKTYMNDGFLSQCDLDSNLKIDGTDALMFFHK
ncbi:hypothetical protein [Caldisericum exile]|uniref:Gingipain domain-containing protein n=1 Tax=Caldisericum exile (strain DSM 21853 / NBRC 104410 / AZM16c01) TaxID=511051 RepID=A0A7U6GD29_CALEA|nr:hypothetical protein [Caldisericum exile]BAL80139.1 hypothetical protein CSE_00130 [Caldisericum exile AZM16c01]